MNLIRDDSRQKEKFNFLTLCVDPFGLLFIVQSKVFLSRRRIFIVLDVFTHLHFFTALEVFMII